MKENITVVDAYGREIRNAKIRKGKDQRVIVSAPGFLERQANIDFNPKSEEVIWLMMDPRTAKGPPLEEACRLNLCAASENAYFGGEALYWWIVDDPCIKASQDRCYFTVVAIHGIDLQAPGLVLNLSRTGTFEKADGSLHDPHEPGWEFVGSWKTTRNDPVLQVTLWRRERAKVLPSPTIAGEDAPIHGLEIETFDEYVAELDIDYGSGLKHVAEVIHNKLTGDKTHPYVVNQLLAWHWGAISFQLEPGE